MQQPKGEADEVPLKRNAQLKRPGPKPADVPKPDVSKSGKGTGKEGKMWSVQKDDRGKWHWVEKLQSDPEATLAILAQQGRSAASKPAAAAAASKPAAAAASSSSFNAVPPPATNGPKAGASAAAAAAVASPAAAAGQPVAVAPAAAAAGQAGSSTSSNEGDRGSKREAAEDACGIEEPLS